MEKSAEASQSDGTLRQQTSPKCIERRSKMIYDPTIHTRKEWKSKTYGFRFDILLEHQKETGQVVCNAENCNRILNRTSFVGLQGHIRLHVSVPSSEKEFSNSLMEFVICSTQSFNVVANCKFISCLDAFQSLVIENYKKGCLKRAADYLPSPKTVSSRVEDKLEELLVQVQQRVACLKQFKGGLTLDFAKNQVDYLAVTAHYVTKEWKFESFVLLFTSLPPGMQKTSNNVERLIDEELEKLGFQEEDKKELYVTTDEGSNVCRIGHEMHQSCLCHLGSTIASLLHSPNRYQGLTMRR